MKTNVKRRVKVPANASPRTRKITCLMSDDEVNIVERYLARYHITNRSRWMRETLLEFINRKMVADYPTLFNEHEMRR